MATGVSTHRLFRLTIVVITHIMLRMPRELRCEPGGHERQKPLAEQEVFLGIQRTGDVLMRDLEEVLKPAALSPTQYNVLRILRGAGDDGLPCGSIAERMITRDPDVTRLLDRLEARELIHRSFGPAVQGDWAGCADPGSGEMEHQFKAASYCISASAFRSFRPSLSASGSLRNVVPARLSSVSQPSSSAQRLSLCFEIPAVL